MRKVVALAVAALFGLGSLSAFAADAAGKGMAKEGAKSGAAKKGGMDETNKSDKAKVKSKSAK